MKKNIKKETLAKIQSNEIKIKSRTYFQVMKIFAYVLTAGLAITATYIFNLMFYLPARALRMVEGEGIGSYLSLLPWSLILIGGLTVGLLVYLYRHYEGGYKKHLIITAVIILGAVFIGGMALAKSNFNEKLEGQPRFQRFYQWNEDNFVPRGPRNRIRQNRLNFARPNSDDNNFFPR